MPLDEKLETNAQSLERGILAVLAAASVPMLLSDLAPGLVEQIHTTSYLLGDAINNKIVTTMGLAFMGGAYLERRGRPFLRGPAAKAALGLYATSLGGIVAAAEISHRYFH